MITYLRVIKNFEGTEEDGDSVAETNLTGILTCNVLIFVGKEHTTKSTKIYTPLRVRYTIYGFGDLKFLCDHHFSKPGHIPEISVYSKPVVATKGKICANLQHTL